MFNTLKYAKMLEDVGFSRVQSETSVKILVEIMDDKFATKQDLKDLHIATQQDFRDLETSIRGDLKEVETSIRDDMKQMETSIRGDMKQMESSIREDMREGDAALKSEITTLHISVNRLSDQFDVKLEKLESKLTLRMGAMAAATIGILTAVQTYLKFH